MRRSSHHWLEDLVFRTGDLLLLLVFLPVSSLVDFVVRTGDLLLGLFALAVAVESFLVLVGATLVFGLVAFLTGFFLGAGISSSKLLLLPSFLPLPELRVLSVLNVVSLAGLLVSFFLSFALRLSLSGVEEDVTRMGDKLRTARFKFVPAALALLVAACMD